MKRYIPLLSALIMFPLLPYGCGGNKKADTTSRTDTSTENQTPRDLSITKECAPLVNVVEARVQGEQVEVQLLTFARTVKSIYKGTPEDTDDISGSIKKVRTSKVPIKGGTFFYPLLKKVLADVSTGHTKTVVILGTDGGIDDTNDLKEIKKAFSDLAALPNVELIIIGPVTTANLPVITKATSGVSKSKLVITDEGTSVQTTSDQIVTFLKKDKTLNIVCAIDNSGSITYKKEEGE